MKYWVDVTILGAYIYDKKPAISGSIAVGAGVKHIVALPRWKWSKTPIYEELKKHYKFNSDTYMRFLVEIEISDEDIALMILKK